MAHEAFISHSSQDKAFADAITAGLEQAGIRCWIAPRDIRPGDSWGGAIVSAIEASKVMVVIFSAKSNDSKQVMREVERAVQHDVVVVPLRIEDVKPTRDMEYFLSSTHWLDAMTPKVDAHIKELVRTVGSILDSDQEDSESPSTRRREPIARAPLHPFKVMLRRIAIWSGIAATIILSLWILWLINSSDTPNDDAAKLSSNPPPKVEAKEEGDVSLDVAKSARAGGRMNVTWSGDSAPNDYIVITKADAADSFRSGGKNVADSKSVEMVLSDKPGDYEVRYFDATSRNIIARETIRLTAPEVKLDAPTEAIAGSIISVNWTGPNDRSDMLTIALQDAPGRDYKSYAYIAKGSPTSIRLPDEAGLYEVRYVSGNERVVWSQKSVSVSAPNVSIDAIDTQLAGAEVMVSWQGPANRSDYLSLAEVGSAPSDYLSYSYLKPAKSAKLRMPARAGKFEIRYISGQSKLIWATQPIEIEMPIVSINAPKQGVAGDVIDMNWEGPANSGDFLSIAEAETDGGEYQAYKYVRKNKATGIQLPQMEGDYVVRYISGVDKTIWFETPITVTRRKESLSAPSEVVAGQSFEVSWQEKGHPGQLLGIYPEDANDDDEYLVYAYTNNKTKAKLSAPDAAGKYELRYISGDKDKVWARTPITVSAAQ